LGEGLEEATVAAWLVAAGDRVELNQPLVEIETAKANVEIPSPHAGRIAELHALKGNVVRVGEPLVTFELEGVNTLPIAPPPAPTSAGIASAGIASAGAARASTRSKIASTPAARKLAKDIGIDISAVTGTGPNGRITIGDVENAAEMGIVARLAGGEAPPGGIAYDPGMGEPDLEAVSVTVGTDADVVPLSPTRRAIADRLTQVVRNVPMVTTWRTIDCSAVENLRAELDVGPLPIVVRALAEVCNEHRALNASFVAKLGEIRFHRRCNVGVAVDTPRGLVVPVVWNARGRGIREIAEEIRRLAEGARNGTLKPEQMTSGTITVSNTGSYGSEAGTPILHDGQAAILALGVIAPRALVVEGAVVARPACTLSLTFDHRVMDGADAGRAFTSLVELLESGDALRHLPA
ncbi:MAG: 2-oxo acid dehydrogenase subunit E2, partial [Actinomycetota bacterium]|nr:2-oxo acid dehydrogenase subunit E2 [Actinomycetota bacterium]